MYNQNKTLRAFFFLFHLLIFCLDSMFAFFIFQGQDCNFLHEGVPERRELCKYYVSDCCLMGNDCIFMHNILSITIYSNLLHDYVKFIFLNFLERSSLEVVSSLDEYWVIDIIYLAVA